MVLGGLAVIVIIFAAAGFRTVDSGKVGVTRRFGKITGTQQAGGFWAQPVGFSMVEYDLRVAKTIEKQQGALCNQQTLLINRAAYQYNLSPKAAAFLLETVGTQDTFERAVVIPKLENAMKSVTPLYCADRVFAERTKVEREMESRLAQDLAKYNIDAASVDITLADVDFDQSYRASIDAKAKAEQDRLVELANLEKQKTKNEQEKQQSRTDAERAQLTAQGEANAVKSRAAGEAESIRLRAQAQAQANKEINSSLTPDLIQYQYALNWNGQLPTTMFGEGGLPLINIPTNPSQQATTPTTTPPNNSNGTPAPQKP